MRKDQSLWERLERIEEEGGNNMSKGVESAKINNPIAESGYACTSGKEKRN